MGDDRRKQRLELLFISFVGIVILGAFITSLTYDLVSARTPLCIMVPLLILVGLQFNRSRKSATRTGFKADLQPVLKGKDLNFNAVMALIGWMALFLVLIYAGGHYAGMVVFVFVLLRFVSKESLRLSLSVTAVLTLSIYLLFEHLFRIELYRGLIYDQLITYAM